MSKVQEAFDRNKAWAQLTPKQQFEKDNPDFGY